MADGSRVQLALEINGRSIRSEIEPRMLLVEFIREVARLTGQDATAGSWWGIVVHALLLRGEVQEAAHVASDAVHTAPLAGSDHVVRGHERSDLLATGALAVDMESAATLLSAVRTGERPVAAVRVVVDAPEHELVRIGTLRGGISAFRVLRTVLPAFYEWHRSLLLPRR